MLRRISKNVAVLDAFPKVEVENQERSEKGGILTMVLTIVLILLTLGELRDYRKLHNTYEFLVDQQIDTKLQINIDLTVAMQCGFLSVDVIDIAGERQHLQNLHTISTRFDVGKARPLGSGMIRELNIRRILKAARYRRQDVPGSSENQGACRVIGSIEVNKVAGNLHITSLGHGYLGGTHTDHEAINFTHRIDEFSFGQLYPSLINPLDESFEISNSHFEQFQYFMSVVPTIYIDRSNNQLLTNQYSVNDYRRAFNAEQPGFVPGLFFKYEIEPISVRITEQRQTFTHFLVRLCGIIGGAFVTVGFAYRALVFVMELPKGKPAPTGAGAAYIPTSNSEKRRF